MYACLFQLPAPSGRALSGDHDQHRDHRDHGEKNISDFSVGSVDSVLNVSALAADFSPRSERHRDDLVSIDVSGLGRLLGTPRAIGEELRRDAARRGLPVHVAIAATRMAAIVLALARPGLTVVDPGDEADALAMIPIGVLEKISACGLASDASELPALTVFRTWGIKTLGELAALPSADLAARLGVEGLAWQAIARGEDRRPLVPTAPDERFEASLDLEWPIEGLEPLSFVLTRLLEPLSTRLERRDRGAAVLHVRLRLISRPPAGAAFGDAGEARAVHVRRLELPSPIRGVRTLRTLALLDLESHPPPEPIDQVAVAIDPTPGRVLQHTLFTRAHPTPEQLSTLLARLGALMGQDRIGAPATIDSDRPGAFEVKTFRTEHGGSGRTGDLTYPAHPPQPAIRSALRRCREPVPARVAVAGGRPVRVTTDRRGFAGGAVLQSAGPWRTSGAWWAGRADRAGEAGASWDRDEWDVALSDGAVYRVFQDRQTDAWFIDAMVD